MHTHILTKATTPETKKKSGTTPFFQAKLTVNTPGDAHEREADQVADQVMRMKEDEELVVQRKSLTPVSTVQRMCADCEEKQEGKAQRQEARSGSGGGQTAPSIVGQVLSSGGGRPIDKGTRQFMEQRFGQDFGQVRIHTGGQAAESASAIQAKAYTSGKDIVFGAGEYRPESGEGKRLLAHELVHVGQQGEMVKRQSSSSVMSENVWGFRVDQSMCSCRPRLSSAIGNANYFRDEYQACNLPAHTDGSAVEDCVTRRNPTATVAGSTDSSGTITVRPSGTSPCERLINRGTLIHETFHSRQADRFAQAIGGAFLSNWIRLRGNPRRLDILRTSFPTEAARFDAMWDNGREWVSGEVESYTWQRRFYEDARRALTRICP